MAKVLRPRFLFPFSLFLAWQFDYFFWGKSIGVSFPFFIVLLVIAGLWLAWEAGLKPATAGYWLLIPITVLSLVSVFRAEPLSLLTSWMVVVMLLAVFALSFLGGRWPHYGFADFAAKLITLIPQGLMLLATPGKPARGKKGKKSALSSLAPVARGLLLVLPLLWFLSILLSSADPFFAEWLGGLFFDLEYAPEYILRGLIILGLAICFAAVYLVAFNSSRDQELLGEEKPLVAPLLGFGEALTMLASVLLLLVSFVAIQFRYFFGGLTNIVAGPSGFTFAEYARRGFSELVIVALAALTFFILLSSITRRRKGRQQNWFSGLGIGLFVLVAVTLVSAFGRLLLLEAAYGFTRFRTYPHVFMIWLAILLLAVVILETLGRQRAFAVAALLAVIGFSLTLPLLNVDAFIVRINVERAIQGAQLDHLYLALLSDDALPELVAAYQDAAENRESALADQLATGIACHVALRSEEPGTSWSSWSYSRAAANDLWSTLIDDAEFPARISISLSARGLPSVLVHGQEVACYDLGLDSSQYVP
ncbi:MAG: DUF4173 domain-containing protein [Anaerolineales bacterium]